jgi:hypothetical protein
MEVGTSEIEALQSSKTSLSKISVTFDDVLAVLGEFGLYQKWIYFLWSLPYVFTSMQLMGWVFIGANVPFKCRNSEISKTLDFEELGNYSEISSCNFIFLNGTETECSVGFVYDTSQIKDSVTMEFELVYWH